MDLSVHQCPTLLPDSLVGIEFTLELNFIILVKKGTHAVDVSSVSSKKEEKELLLAPGTKFKVLRMELDGNAEIVEAK